MTEQTSNDPEMIRAEIERTRGDLSRDVNALGEAVSPGNVAKRQASKVGESISGAATSVKELIALAKKEPGKLTYASPGSGSSMHLGGELLKTMAGIDMLHAPYKGSGGAYPDVFAGRVSVGLTTRALTGLRAARSARSARAAGPAVPATSTDSGWRARARTRTAGLRPGRERSAGR